MIFPRDSIGHISFCLQRKNSCHQVVKLLIPVDPFLWLQLHFLVHCPRAVHFSWTFLRGTHHSELVATIVLRSKTNCSQQVLANWLLVRPLISNRRTMTFCLSTVIHLTPFKLSPWCFGFCASFAIMCMDFQNHFPGETACVAMLAGRKIHY